MKGDCKWAVVWGQAGWLMLVRAAKANASFDQASCAHVLIALRRD